MKRIPWMLMLWGGMLAGCSGDANPLAPYEGARPLILQQVTRSARPDLQWVGGRVAALGINRGTTPAFDATLVWLRRSDSDAIDSPVTVGPGLDAETIRQLGGTPLDSLPSGEAYTFWVAELEAFDALQDAAEPAPGTFVDTTFTLQYMLSGFSRGDPQLDVDFQIIRNQTLVSDTYTVTWTPSDLPFGRLAIRHATLGGFTDLIWHIAVPDGAPDSILPPVVLGQPPPGTIEAQEWTGFETVPDTLRNRVEYTLWAVTSEWNGGSFSPSSRNPGYVSFGIVSDNFKR